MWIPPAPEPCLKDRCWSRFACAGWGFCRARNEADGDANIEAKRAAAAERKALAEMEAPDGR